MLSAENTHVMKRFPLQEMKESKSLGSPPVTWRIVTRLNTFNGLLLLAAVLSVASSVGLATDSKLELHARSRVESTLGSGEFRLEEKTLEWDAAKTAIVICDMWDRHWCKGATGRVGEMAPRMNEVIKAARQRGVFIIHCPSDTINFYKDTPQRRLAQAAPKATPKVPLEGWCQLDPKHEAPLPIDDSDGGCDDEPQCRSGQAWQRQIATLEMQEGDAVTDSAEAYYLMQQRGIENVIIMGVHANMCVLGRPFSIRQMVRQGKNVVLMRDLTDTMYNSRQRPFVSHFAGTDLIVSHVEKYWCPSITSADFVTGPPFRFREDRRPKVVFIIGENEYVTWETLPIFARQDLEWRGIDCSFVMASSREGDNDFKDFQAIKDADLLFISVRRRAPPKEMLALIRAHVAAGKPLVGLRTASHAFAATPSDDQHEAWPGFDTEVLGGEYGGHYGNKPPADPPTVVRRAPNAGDHAVLTGLPLAEFQVTSHLYKNLKQASTVTPLLVANVEGQRQIEPVAWVNTNLNRRVFYTSLGNPDDFKLPAFRRLLLNGVLWTLRLPIPPDVPNQKAGITPAPAKRSPAEESLNPFKLDPDLELEVAASEPDLGKPVYLTFDERGRMWVVQYLQYPFPAGLKVVGHDEFWRVKYDHFPPPPPPNQVKGADKITVFEDRDGDGRFESHKDFVTGLNICTAALPGRGGVWVLNPPYLLFYPDTNRDDVPDGDPVVHLEGFGMEDLHAVASSLTWGPDGWLYGCQGSTCTANIRRPGLDREGRPFRGQCVWRYHPETRRFELFAEGGYNNFGIAVDNKFRLFTGSNGGVIGVHYVQGGYYQKTWGKHGPLTNPYAFGYFDAMRDQSSHAKLSQAMIVYEAEEFPEEYRHRMLVARVLQYRIDLCDLHPEGSTYAARELRAVCSTPDKNFRPVDLKIGPDGSVYIADWREDNVTWNVTAEGHAVNRANGRIYRLKSKGTPRPGDFDFARLSSAQLLQQLAHPNIWHRQMVQRILADRPDPSLIPELQQIVEADSGQRALEALWATSLCGGFSQDFALRQLRHPDPFVRLWTIRLLGDDGRINASIHNQLLELARAEPESQVRSQLACSAKRMPAQDALPIVQALAARAEDIIDPHLPLLLWWVVEDKLRNDREIVFRWLQDSSLWEAPLFRKAIISRLGQRFTIERTAQDFEQCAKLLQLAAGANEVGQFVQGMVRGLAGNKVDQVPPKLEQTLAELWRRQGAEPEMLNLSIRLGRKEAVADALKIIADNNAPESQRVALLRLLAERSETRAVDTLIGLLRESSSTTLQAEALTAAQRFGDERVGRAILAALPRWNQTQRDKAFTILASRPGWALLLLAQVDRGDLPARQVPADVVVAMQSLSDPKAKEVLDKHWGNVRKSPEEKLKRIAEVKVLLGRGPGNIQAGKALFSQTCAKCHMLFGEGTKAGPELTGLERNNLDQLLQSIVDPSAVILPEFMASDFTLKEVNGSNDEEQTIAGFVVQEDANSVTIINTAGTQSAVPKSSIASRRILSLSIMPEGLLDSLEEQQIRDLVSFVQSQPPKTLSNQTR